MATVEQVMRAIWDDLPKESRFDGSIILNYDVHGKPIHPELSDLKLAFSRRRTLAAYDKYNKAPPAKAFLERVEQLREGAYGQAMREFCRHEIWYEIPPTGMGYGFHHCFICDACMGTI